MVSRISFHLQPPILGVSKIPPNMATIVMSHLLTRTSPKLNISIYFMREAFYPHRNSQHRRSGTSIINRIPSFGRCFLGSKETHRRSGGIARIYFEELDSPLEQVSVLTFDIIPTLIRGVFFRVYKVGDLCPCPHLQSRRNPFQGHCRFRSQPSGGGNFFPGSFGPAPQD